MSTNVGEIDLSLILNSDKFSSQLKNVDAQANKASSKISASLSKIGKAALAAFSVAAVVKFGKECLNVATETSNAWIGLNSILTGQGKSFQQAKKFINDYISDGLVPLNNAVTTYKNLAARGYNPDQIQKTMIALKNSATFGRQSTYSLGEAVQTASEGLKNENSILVDNAGVTKNVAKMWEDYAKSIGKTTNQLTKQEKIQAEVNGILQETKFQSNDAAIYANTFSGKVAQLSQAFTSMKTAIGNVIQPIAKLFIPVITTAVNAVTKLFTALAGLMSLFGLKADSVETVSNGIEGIAASAGDASDAIEGVGDSAKKAGKDAKKASNNLAAFDNLNVLQKDDSNSSGSSSGNSGSSSDSTDITDSLDVTSTIKNDTTAFDGLLAKIKQLVEIFKSGFDISFGDTNFDKTLTHLNNIKATLVDIFNDSEVLGAANNWIKTLSYALGQATGSIARIGVNIAEGFIGSIDNYLSQNVDRIKSFIINMFNISSKDIALTGNLWQALGEISDVFKSDTAKQIGANIIAMFANPLMSAAELCGKFALDLKGILLQPIIDNVQKIKTTIENVMKPVQNVTEILADAMTYIGDKWNKVYDGNIHPLMESLKTGLSDTFSKFLDVYNTYVVPSIENISKKIKELWNTNLKPFVDNVTELIASISDAITVLWNKILKPIIDWSIKNITPILVPIFETLYKTICNIVGLITNLMNTLMGVFKGVIDFVVGVFTGDWNKAWNSIKSIFQTILNGIKTHFTGVINTIKDVFQGAINWIKAGISSWGSTINNIWNNIWNTIKTATSTIWNGIKTLISNAINNIKTNNSNVLNTIKATWNTVLTNIKTIATNIFNAVKTTITNIMNNIKTTISNITNAIKTIINTVLNAIKTTINTVMNSIKTIVTNIWTAIKTVIINTINNIKTNITTIFNNIKSTISTILNAVKTTINTIWTSIKTIITNILNTIKNTISSIWNGIKTVINTVINSIKNNVNNVFNSIKTSITKVFNNIKSSASSIWNSIKSNITSSVNGIKSNIVNAFSSAYNSIKSKFNNISSFFSGIWSRVRNTFSSLGTNIGNAISSSVKRGINGVISMIQNTINSAINLINGAINLINRVPGVNVGNVGYLNLPRLAQGGYVKANTPQLAVIGDNKTHGEIVAPEDKLLEQNLKALKIFKEQESGINNKADSGQTININFNGTLSQLIRALKPELDKEDKRKGTKLVIGGVS